MYQVKDPELHPDDWVSYQQTILEQLQEPFMDEKTVLTSSPCKPSFPASFSSIVPPEFPLHPWLMLCGYDPCQKLSLQTKLHLKTPEDVKDLMETRAVTWLERSIRGAKNRPFTAIGDACSLSQAVGDDFPTAHADFAFVYGESQVGKDNVIAVLQTKALGDLALCGQDSRPAADDIAREARALAKLFNTRRVMFFDAIQLVIFEWDRNADPETDAVRQVYELDVERHSKRIRASMLRVICEGLDEKVGYGQWF
ncbi:hypothetical protein KEM56_006703 [Ascosphaera pollenicola]|nr:hypothetical protein KEM56_006703 [Ascosphaera pollenicola]